MDRITYKNLLNIFVIELDDSKVEVGTIPDLPEEFYPEPYNKYVIIHDFYKYPDRVKEYAEACQYTNYSAVTGRAPVLRTYAPQTNDVQETVRAALGFALGKNFMPAEGADLTAMFSYTPPTSMKYHKYREPHIDTNTYHPMWARSNVLPEKDADDRNIQVEQFFTDSFKKIAGVIYLDDTFGTTIYSIKEISYYMSKDKQIYGAPPFLQFNDNYWPEKNDLNYERIITLGGEYNSAVFYYDSVFHSAAYKDASTEDLKNGRLIQNVWYHDTG